MLQPEVAALTHHERGEEDRREQQHHDRPRPASRREEPDRRSERREAETEDGEASRNAEPAPLDTLVHDGPRNGLQRRQLADRGAAVRAETRARRELLAAPRARVLPDWGRAHDGLLPRAPAPVTRRRPACATAPPARGSPRPRSSPSGGRTRAPSAPRARDLAPRPAPTVSAPPERARRGGRLPGRDRGGTGAQRRRRRRPRASPRARAPTPRQIPAGAAPAAYRAASRRCSTASGHIAISAPATKTKPATQIRLTSGFTKSFRSMFGLPFLTSCAVVKTSPIDRGSW